MSNQGNILSSDTYDSNIYGVNSKQGVYSPAIQMRRTDIIQSIIITMISLYMKYVNFEFKVKSSAIKMLTLKDNSINSFMYGLLCEKDLHQDTHTRSYISMVEPMTVSIPCTEEQRLIADFLSDFDVAIAATKRELELWKELKKGLLQQMFV